MNNKQKSKGITLIALVVTIVVLLILAGVSINLILGENGLISKAKDSRDQYAQGATNDEISMNNLYDEMAGILGESNGGSGGNIGSGESGENGGEIVDTSVTRVGYYADLEGNDGVPEGIIYADLAFSVSDQWYDSNGAFSYTAKTGLKEYVVTKATYNDGHFGDAPVIAPKSGTSGNDRFYVMALSDFGNSSTYYWNRNYDYDYNYKFYGTELTFGTGRSNTEKMVNYWKNNPTIEIPIYDDSGNSDYDDSGSSEVQGDTKYISDWDSRDIWNNIENNNWFVPSRAEWAAFAKNLGITTNKFGLGNYGYWSSSQYSSDYSRAWSADFFSDRVNVYGVRNGSRVRLSTTF